MKTGQYILLCLFSFLLVQGAHAQGAVRVDTTVLMSDGVILDAVYAYPTIPPPSSGYPAILLIHGFGGSKDVNGALSWANKGYVGVAYSVRGQGASGGEFDFFTSTRIRGDLQEMIAFTKSMPGVNTERVGVTGGSQGGIHAWMAAAYDMGVRTVISVVANGRFEDDFANNNAFNYIFSMTLQLANVRFTSFVKDTVIPALKNDDYSFVRSQLEYYSTKNREESVATPTFIMVSYFDQFFDPRAALEQFKRIPAPKKIAVYPGAHGYPTDAGHAALVTLMADRWFAYWLKDEMAGNDIANPESAVVMMDAGTKGVHTFALADSAYYLRSSLAPQYPPERMRFYLDGSTLAAAPPPAQVSATIPYISGLGSTNAVFRSDPVTSDVVIAGAPGEAVLYGNSPAGKYQLNLVLFDFDPATSTYLPVTRGHYQVRNNTATEREELRFSLNSVCHTLKAGHLIEVRVGGGIGLLPKSGDDFGNVVVGTGVTAVDTVFTGGPTASYFDLYAMPGTVQRTTDLTTPATLRLENYPNPFGPGSAGGQLTIFRFALPAGSARLEIFDQLGRRVRMLFDADMTPGEHESLFTPGDLPAGIYHAVLTSGRNMARRSVIYLR